MSQIYADILREMHADDADQPLEVSEAVDAPAPISLGSLTPGSSPTPTPDAQPTTASDVAVAPATHTVGGSSVAAAATPAPPAAAAASVAAVSSPAEKPSRHGMHLLLVRILEFFLRDVHMSQTFTEQALDAEAIFDWLIDRVALRPLESNGDPDTPDPIIDIHQRIALATHCMVLFSSHQLPWSYYFSWLPALLSSLADAAIIVADPNLPLEHAIRLVPQIIHTLGTIWSRGYQLFSFYAPSTAPLSQADLTREVTVAHSYQQLLSIIQRIDWTSKITAATDVTSDQINEIGTIRRYISHLISLWPNSALTFHRFVQPRNAPGLTPLIDAAHAAMQLTAPSVTSTTFLSSFGVDPDSGLLSDPFHCLSPLGASRSASLTQPAAPATPAARTEPLSKANFFKLPIQQRSYIRNNVATIETLLDHARESDRQRAEARRIKRHASTAHAQTTITNDKSDSKKASAASNTHDTASQTNSHVQTPPTIVSSTLIAPIKPAPAMPTSDDNGAENGATTLQHANSSGIENISVGDAPPSTDLSFPSDVSVLQFDVSALARASPISPRGRARLHRSADSSSPESPSTIRSLLVDEIRVLRSRLATQLQQQERLQHFANITRARKRVKEVTHQPVNKLPFMPITRHVPAACMEVEAVSLNKEAAAAAATGAPSASDRTPDARTHDSRLNAPFVSVRPPKVTEFASVPASVGLDGHPDGAPHTTAATATTLKDWSNQIKQQVFKGVNKQKRSHHYQGNRTSDAIDDEESLAVGLDDELVPGGSHSVASGSSRPAAAGVRYGNHGRPNPPVRPLLAESLGFFQPIPTSTHYTTITTNVPKEDVTELQFLPYFGDETQMESIIDVDMYSNLDTSAREEDESNRAAEHKSNRPDHASAGVTKSAVINFRASSTPPRLKPNTVVDDSPTLGSGTSDAHSGSSPRRSCGTSHLRRKRRRTEIEFDGEEDDKFDPVRDAIVTYATSTYTEPTIRRVALELIADEFHVSLASLEHRLTELDSISEPITANTPSSSGDVLRNPLDSFSQLWCRRCFQYDCAAHGPSQPIASSILYGHQRQAEGAPITIKRKIPEHEALFNTKRRSKPGVPIDIDEHESKEERTNPKRLFNPHTLDWAVHESGPAADPTPCSVDCFLHSIPTLSSSSSSSCILPSPPHPPSPPQLPSAPSMSSPARHTEPTAHASDPSPTSIPSRIATFVTALFAPPTRAYNTNTDDAADEVSMTPAHVPAPMTAPSSPPVTGSRHVAATHPAAGATSNAWSPIDQAMLRRAYFVMTSILNTQPLPSIPPHVQPVALSPDDVSHSLYCRLARLIGRPCNDVATFCLANESTLVSHGSEHRTSITPNAAKEAAATLTLPRLSKATFDARLKVISKQYCELALHFAPCQHEGDCNESSACACSKSDMFCESSCGCPPSCANRYRGCRCVSSRCQTKTCSCFLAQRECDPDLCRSCGAEVELDIGLRAQAESAEAQDPHPTHRCNNVALRSGRKRLLLLGRSETHGWGAFAGETLDKDRFITEYTGEVISHGEADRRGRIYDQHNRSYLFNLNDEFVVDAARKGSRIRFANHGEKEDANCYPRVIAVNGDHRIILMTRRKIQCGEELRFDYAHDHDRTWNESSKAPTWFKRSDSNDAAESDSPPAPTPHAASHAHANTTTQSDRARSRARNRTRTRTTQSTHKSTTTITANARATNENINAQ